MGDPTVSIVIPCFNRRDMVADAIASALAEGPDVEVIVVDDGSIDGSWDAIAATRGIRSLRIDHRGVSAARNAGLALAAGSFVRFLDSDDLIVAGSTHAMLREIGRLGARDIAVGSAVPDNEGEVAYGYDRSSGTLGYADLMRRTLPCLLPLWPIEALRGVGGFDEGLDISEDLELSARVHGAGWTFRLVDHPMVTVRHHGGARLTRSRTPESYRSQLAALTKALAQLSVDDAGARRALAQSMWVVARDASRLGYRPEASALFACASSIGGSAATVGSNVAKALYRFMDPYTAERLLMRAKHLAGGR